MCFFPVFIQLELQTVLCLYTEIAFKDEFIFKTRSSPGSACISAQFQFVKTVLDISCITDEAAYSCMLLVRQNADCYVVVF